MKVGVYHKWFLLAECATELEAWEKATELQSLFSPVGVRKIETSYPR